MAMPPRPVLPVLLLVSLVACAVGGRRPAASTDRPWLAVEPTLVDDGRVWFSDELEPIADAVADVLARPASGGLRVIPTRELRGFWRKVVGGHLPGVARPCETPPPPALLLDLVYPRSGRAVNAIRCDAISCSLDVAVRWPGTTDEEDARFRADLPLDGTPGQWAALIRRDGLRAVPDDRNPAGGLRGRGAAAPSRRIRTGPGQPDVLVELEAVGQSGPWADRLTPEPLQPLAQRLKECELGGPVDRDARTQGFVVELGENGRPTRCEPDAPDHLVSPEFQCKCQVLRGAQLGPGRPGRRARFSLSLLLAKPRELYRIIASARLEGKRADDPSAILGEGEVSPPAVDACFAFAPLPMIPLRVPARFTVGADGRVTAASAAWPAEIMPGTAACLDSALARARFSCPLSGRAAVSATLELSGMGYIDREAIRRVIRSHADEVRGCYDDFLVAHPPAGGMMTLTWVIRPDGSVGEAKLERWTIPPRFVPDPPTTLPGPEVSDCVIERLKTWTFQRPSGGGQAVITYPWILVPARGWTWWPDWRVERRRPTPLVD